MSNPFTGILELLGKVFKEFQKARESRERLKKIKKKSDEAMRRRKELGRRPLSDRQRERLNAIMSIDVPEDERLRLLARFDEETGGAG